MPDPESPDRSSSEPGGPHAEYFPAIDEELRKRVDLPATADEDAIRNAFAERRRLYESRTGATLPKPVRQQNAMLLAKLDQLAPALEEHLTAVRTWRILGEASVLLDQGSLARSRTRLEEARGLLQRLPQQEVLRRWAADLLTEVEDRATREPVVATPIAPPPPVSPVTAPPAAPIAPASVPPVILAPSEAPGQVGQPFVCAFLVHPPGLAVSAAGLPAGLVLDTAGNRVMGHPAEPGEFAIELRTAGAGGSAHATIRLRVAPPLPIAPTSQIPAAPAVPETAPAPPLPPVVEIREVSTTGVAPAARSEAAAETTLAAPVPLPPPNVALDGTDDRLTIQMPGGRRLHVFAGHKLRLGRAAEADLAVTCVVRNNPNATVAITKEISRHHCELSLAGARLMVRDGWSGDDAGSKFGTYLDVHRVSTAGMNASTGQTLKLTARPAGPGVAHWRITCVERAALRGAPAAYVPTLSAGPETAGAWLRRMDDGADDILLVWSTCELSLLELSPYPLWIRRGATGWEIGTSNAIAPISHLGKFLRGAAPGPVGVVRPLTAHAAVQLASGR